MSMPSPSRLPLLSRVMIYPASSQSTAIAVTIVKSRSSCVRQPEKQRQAASMRIARLFFIFSPSI